MLEKNEKLEGQMVALSTSFQSMKVNSLFNGNPAAQIFSEPLLCNFLVLPHFERRP